MTGVKLFFSCTFLSFKSTIIIVEQHSVEITGEQVSVKLVQLLQLLYLHSNISGGANT